MSKTLREVAKPQSQKRSYHCCGIALQNDGIGYNDLNELIKCPQDLEFTIGIDYLMKLILIFYLLLFYNLSKYMYIYRTC